MMVAGRLGTAMGCSWGRDGEPRVASPANRGSMRPRSGQKQWFQALGHADTHMGIVCQHHRFEIRCVEVNLSGKLGRCGYVWHCSRLTHLMAGRQNA